MEKKDVLQRDVQNDTRSPLLNEEEKGANFDIGSHFKKLVYISCIAGMGFFLNSCLAGYVASEPAYVEYSRPARPSNVHVWIDGDWNWNSHTHAYIQRTGSWERQRHGQTYVSGYWQTTPRGRSWAKGHWQRQGQHDRSRR